MNIFKPRESAGRITPLLIALILVAAPLFIPDRAQTAEVRPTPTSMDLFGTINKAEPGDRLTIYDGDGVLCGSFIINKAGQYGFVPVYGDDPTTAEDEGAEYGDRLTFKLNNRPVSPVSGHDVYWTGDRERERVNLDL